MKSSSSSEQKTTVLSVGANGVQLGKCELPESSTAVVGSDRFGQITVQVSKAASPREDGTRVLTENQSGLYLYGSGLESWFHPDDQIVIDEAA